MINKLADSIDQSISKQYFINDVIGSYNNRSYRSCVISIWNIVLLDLELKMKDLHQLANGSSNQKIYEKLLNYFAEIREEKKLGEELKLIEDISKTTKLVTPFELEGFIKRLKLERNLCAHPIDGDKLHTPNEDTVKGFINESIKILHKKSFNYDLYFNEILEDIGHYLKYYTNFRIDLKEDDHGIQLLFHKFFKNMNNAEIIKFFKALWKFVFSGKNPEEIKNRIPNFMVLKFLCKEYSKIIQDNITVEKNKYVTKVTSIKENFDLLFVIFVSNIDIFMELNSEEIITFFNASSSNHECCILSAIFSKSSLLSWHYVENKDKHVVFDNYYLSLLLKFEYQLSYYLPKIKDDVIALIIEYYYKSSCYNDADSNFICVQDLINNNLLNKEFIKKLITEANNNSQCFGRGRASIDHKNVYGYCKQFFTEIELLQLTTDNQYFFR